MYQTLKLSLLFLIVFAIGCSVSTKTTLTTGSARPPISPDKVKIYSCPEKVPGKFEEVAILNSEGHYKHTDFAEMYTSMREEAAKIGANGLILGKISEPPLHEKIISTQLPIGADRQGIAIAIYVFPLEKQD